MKANHLSLSLSFYYFIYLLLILPLLINPQAIDYTKRYPSKQFPLTHMLITSPLNTLYIAGSDGKMNTLQIPNGWTLNTESFSIRYDITSNMIPFGTSYLLLKTATSSFTIYRVPSPYNTATLITPLSPAVTHTYKSESISLFKDDTNTDAFVAFITNSDSIAFIKFDQSREKAFKEYPGRKVKSNIHCIQFTSSSSFACFYVDDILPDKQCVLNSFAMNDMTTIDSEKPLGAYGCDNSLGGRLYAVSTSTFFICSMKTDQSVNCLKGSNGLGGLLGTFSNSKIILGGCSTSFVNFNIATFKSDYIIFCSNGNVMKMQEVDASLNFLKPIISLLEGASNNIAMPTINKFDGFNAALVYSDSSDNSIVYTMLIAPTCTSFNGAVTTNGVLLLDFDGNIFNSGYSGIEVQFKSLPSIGSVVVYNPTESNVLLYTSYNYLTVNPSYKAGASAGIVTFDFIGINKGLFITGDCTATITISKCYISCFTCTAVGIPTAHQCTVCVNGYFPLFRTAQCYNNLTIPPGNFFDGTATYYPCDISCAECIDTAVKCTKCAAGYSWKNINRDSCINSKPVGFYLDTISNTYLQCYHSCSDCTYAPTPTSHSCQSCKAALTYPIDNYPGNCVDELTKPPNYYLTGGTYKQCYISCGACTTAGSSASHNCQSNMCNPDGFYKPLDTNRKMCYNESTKPIDTYYDNLSQTYKKCFTSCASCTYGLVGSNHNCINCNAGLYLSFTNCVNTCPSPTYKLLEGSIGLCVDDCPIYTEKTTTTCVICSLVPSFLYKGKCITAKPPSTYISNDKYQILDDCFGSCLSCRKEGFPNEMNCDSCKPSFAYLEDHVSNCYNSAPDGYYPNSLPPPTKYLKCYSTCKTCSTAGNTPIQNCLSCIKDYEFNPRKPTNCVKTCDGSVSHWFNDDLNEFHCTPTLACPTKYSFYVPSTNECALSCSQCLGCVGNPYYTHHKTCVIKCPDNSIQDTLTLNCNDLGNVDALLKALPRHITTSPPNKVLFSSSMSFNFCNTNTVQWEACLSNAQAMSLAVIDFSSCFTSLIKAYALTPTATFYTGVFDIKSDYAAPQVEYVIFDSKGTMLDLKFCSNNYIMVNKTVNVQQDPVLVMVQAIEEEYGYNILNVNSSFYSDICTPFTSEYGNDVLLEDRGKYIFPQSLLCEEGCEYGEMYYDNDDVNTKSRIECKCKTKTTANVDIKGIFIKNSHNFTSTDTPLHFFTCYNLLLNIAVFKGNIGNYFLLIFMVAQIGLSVWFCSVGHKPLFSYLRTQLTQVASQPPAETQSESEQAPQTSYPITIQTPTPLACPPPKTVKADDILNEVRQEQAGIKEQKVNICREYANMFIGHQYESNEDNNDGNNQGNDDDDDEDDDYYYNNKDKLQLPENKPEDDPTITKGETEPYQNRPRRNTQSPNRRRSTRYGARNNSVISNMANIYNNEKYQEDLKRAEVHQYERFLERLRKYDNKSFYYIYCYNIKKKHRLLSLFLLQNVYEIPSFKLSMLILSITFDMFFSAILLHNDLISNLFTTQRRIDIGLAFGFGFCTAFFAYAFIRTIEMLMDYKMPMRRLAAKTEKDKEFYKEMYRKIRGLKMRFVLYYIAMFLIEAFMWYFITVFCETLSNMQFMWGIQVVISLAFSWSIPFLYYLIFTAVIYKGIKLKSMNWYKWGSIGLRF